MPSTRPDGAHARIQPRMRSGTTRWAPNTTWTCQAPSSAFIAARASESPKRPAAAESRARPRLMQLHRSSSTARPGVCSPRFRPALDKSAVAANKSAVPSVAATFAQAAEFAGLLAAKPRPRRSCFAKSAVFVPVTSGSGPSPVRRAVRVSSAACPSSPWLPSPSAPVCRPPPCEPSLRGS
jgi:hypothetical protein